ncbi:hypothetical protein BBP00_00002575 [Phytophthora kernoviae]|uniref:Uncharacterized protein n=1 Tax=Phytophthora kernoviae TaxID=325452 RepID=A0A3F2RXU4_9STRA|nr:hypothetical protein BBP00_00002575 [Phytophthora kernoviae]
MSFLIRAVVVVSVLAIVQAAQIDFDEVEPFPETKPTTDEYAVGLKFKPQIYVPTWSCYPYPAVDADGNTSGGSPHSLLGSKCQGSKYGSQVYSRTAVYKDAWAIMSFGLYRTYAPPGSDKFDGDSVKVRYMNVNGVRYLKTTQESGEFQDLVMWKDLTDEARAALETSDFGLATVPFVDDEFLSNLKKAYPW